MKIVDANGISEVQTYLGLLYGEINEKRSWHDIYGYLSRTTGYLTRNLLREKIEVKDFIRSLSWLFALANKFDVDIDASFYKKFPTICPYCLESKCCCVRTNKKPKNDKPAYKIKEELKAKFQAQERFNQKSFFAAMNNIDEIYPANKSVWHFAGPWVNCSKIFEEVAEVHEALSKYQVEQKTKENVEEEFADVFAWLLSAWNSCYNARNLDEEIKNYFYDDCPVCRSNPCACDTNDSRIQGLVDAKKFSELRELFEELKEISPDAEGDMKELIESLKSAEATQNEAVANAAIHEAQSTYEKLTEGLEKTGNVAQKLASIGKAIDYLRNLL